MKQYFLSNISSSLLDNSLPLPPNNDFVQALLWCMGRAGGGANLRDLVAGNNSQMLSKRPTSMLNTYGASDYSSHRIPWISQLLIFLYAMLSSLGVLCNIVVVVALLQHRTLNNITNIFVLTLAFSDIVLCSLNIPFQTYYEISEQTSFDTAACRILFSCFALPLYVSCLTILLIAIDRHQLIVYPLFPRMSTVTAVGLIGVVILISLLNSIPVAVYTTGKSMGSHQYCVETWPSQGLRLLYSVAIFTIQFFFPLLASGGMYLRVYYRLSKRVFKKKEADHKHRTNKILMSVVACFAICWTPWCLYSLLLEVQAYLQKSGSASQNAPPGGRFDCKTIQQPLTNASAPMSLISGRHLKLIDLLLKLFAMGSACVNPFLYGWLNEPIRDAMKRLWGRVLNRSKRGNNANANYRKGLSYGQSRTTCTMPIPAADKPTPKPVDALPMTPLPDQLLENTPKSAENNRNYVTVSVQSYYPSSSPSYAPHSIHWPTPVSNETVSEIAPKQSPLLQCATGTSCLDDRSEIPCSPSTPLIIIAHTDTICRDGSEV